MMERATRKRDKKAGAPSLARVTYTFVALGMLLSTPILWAVLNDRLALFQETALIHAVEGRARGAHLDFARSLHRDWAGTLEAAEQASSGAPDVMRAALAMLARGNERPALAAIVGVDGVISAASHEALEGRDVSQEGWFRRGLERPSGGTIATTPELAGFFRKADGNAASAQLLQFSAPVVGAEEQVTGVAVLLIDASWLGSQLQETARALQLDLYVIDRGGEVIVASDPASIEGLDLPSLRAALMGVGAEGLELWSDEAIYFTTVVPNISYAALPPLGWGMVARISSDTLAGPNRVLTRGVLILLGTLAMLAAALTVLFVQAFLRPVSLLADSATAIAGGNQEYPYESRRTRELVLLGAALSRLQSIAQSRRPGSDKATADATRMSDGGRDRRQARDSVSR